MLNATLAESKLEHRTDQQREPKRLTGEIMKKKYACILLTLVSDPCRSEEHTSELQSHLNLVCRLLLEKKKPTQNAKRCTLTIEINQSTKITNLNPGRLTWKHSKTTKRRPSTVTNRNTYNEQQ